MIFRVLSRPAALLCLLALPAICWGGRGLPSGFVHLDQVAPGIRQDMRYHGHANFLGRPVRGYEAPRCILARPAAQALASVQAALEPQGLSLKVFDCYRPQRAVDDFMRWAKRPDDPALRSLYYPRLGKAQLLSEVYIAGQSGHSRGSTVDLTIVRANPTRSATRHDGCSPEAAQRDGALDMGSGFDCFDPLSNTDSPQVTAAQRANRHFLKRLMERQGFRNYEREWWHYTLNLEPFPEQYFDFPVR